MKGLGAGISAIITLGSIIQLINPLFERRGPNSVGSPRNPYNAFKVTNLEKPDMTSIAIGSTPVKVSKLKNILPIFASRRTSSNNALAKASLRFMNVGHFRNINMYYKMLFKTLMRR